MVFTFQLEHIQRVFLFGWVCRAGVRPYALRLATKPNTVLTRGSRFQILQGNLGNLPLKGGGAQGAVAFQIGHL